MNKKYLHIILLALFAILSACSGDTPSSGGSLLDDQDRIVVGVDTFSTVSHTLDITLTPDSFPIYSTPDSFLLGECDSRFGTLHADILAQFACPEGFAYPDRSEVDSVCLFFYYSSWFGDGYSPMSVDIYPLNTVLHYDQPYSHNIDINEFVDPSAPSVLDRQRIIVAAHPTDSTYDSDNRRYRSYVRCRLTDAFAQDFFLAQDFSSQERFNEQFKGLYLKSNFGGSTLLHVTDINIAVYYHYTYQKAGRDTTVNDVKGFYANPEVRQINRYQYFTHTDTEDAEHNRDAMLANTEKNFIVAPANLYTRVSLPVRALADTILQRMRYEHTTASGTDTLMRRPYISKAEIALELLNYGQVSSEPRYDWASPATSMLLIKESAIKRFFTNHELPSDTCAILSSITPIKINNDSTGYYYTYDLSSLLTQIVRSVESASTSSSTSTSSSSSSNGSSLSVGGSPALVPNSSTFALGSSASDSILAAIPDTLNMLLIPVSVTKSGTSYSSTGVVTAIKQEQIVSATEIRSAVSSIKPLSLEVVYSGF